MTTNTFRGLVAAMSLAAIFTASGAQAQSKPAPTPKLTSGVAKALNDAQKATQTEDWAKAKTAIDAAAAVANPTDWDKYMIAEFTRLVDSRTQDIPGFTAASLAMADSPVQPDADKLQNYKIAAQLSLQNKQYDKAQGYAKSLQALNPTDASSLDTIAKSYYFAKDYPSALAVAQKQVDGAKAAGKKPDSDALNILVSIQSAMKDEDGAEKTLEELVADYGEKNDWQQMIDIAFGAKGQRDIDAVWLGRLLFVGVADVTPQDASIIGQTASHLTFYGDAQKAQQAGGTGFPDANANAAKDKATIAAQIAAGQKANGQYNIKLAEALYSYDMYTEAEAATRLAITKGGITDASEPQMLLGQILAAQGKYDDALAAFGQVNGGGPATPRIVRLWIDYVNFKKAPPAPAAAAAAK